MNFTQMHERLRLELLRRIQRGTVSVSLLARQTGIGQSHLSSFLHRKKHLSLEAADRVMAAQRLEAADLLPATSFGRWEGAREGPLIPVVSDETAMYEPFIRPSAMHGSLQIAEHVLRTARAQASVQRRSWQRFVAVKVGSHDAHAMDPVLLPQSTVLLDRHYNTLTPYAPDRLTIFGVRNRKRFTLRYAESQLGRVSLRPHNLACPLDFLDPEPGESPRDLIVGRVALILNEL